jgi:hypothetical protein
VRPACPWELEHVWGWFWEVLNGCPANGMTAVTISWRDIAAWCAMTGERPTAAEARLLLRLSVLRANIESEDKAAPAGKPA